MKYIVTIDGTICSTETADPFYDRIAFINNLHSSGHEVVYYTDRDLELYDYTVRQLEEWGCEYTKLAWGKPEYDVWVDGKAQDIFDSDVFRLYKTIMNSERMHKPDNNHSWFFDLKHRILRMLTRT